MLLEKEQDELSTHRTLREQREATLESVREMYQQMQGQLKTERQQCERTSIETLISVERIMSQPISPVPFSQTVKV